MNFGQAAKTILASVAPLIGTAIGGPFGTLAGTVLSKALGTNDPKSVEAAITSGDPDIMLKIKQADDDFKEHMEALNIQEESLVFTDRDSARKREMSVQDWTPRVLAFLFVCCWFALQWYIITHIIDASVRELLLRTMGTMDTALGIILNYYFGSSFGSARKTDALAGIVNGK